MQTRKPHIKTYKIRITSEVESEKFWTNERYPNYSILNNIAEMGIISIMFEKKETKPDIQASTKKDATQIARTKFFNSLPIDTRFSKTKVNTITEPHQEYVKTI